MNLQVNLGKTLKNNDFIIDLQKAAAHNILVSGLTGSGKSYIDHQIIRQLTSQNTPDEVGFVIIDLKRVEYSEYENSPYRLEPIVYTPKEGLVALVRYAELAKARDQGLESNKQAVVVMIEECDIVYENPGLFEKYWMELAEYKNNSEIYVVFSSSRASREVFSERVVNHSDLQLFLITKDTPKSYLEVFGKKPIYLVGKEMG